MPDPCFPELQTQSCVRSWNPQGWVLNVVLAPDGTDVPTSPVCRRIDNAMVKAIARAFRWRDLLENGTHATIAEI